MKSKKICLIIIFIILALFTTSCDDKKSDIDMKKFIKEMQKENNISADKKKEIRKSIFPNLIEKE